MRRPLPPDLLRLGDELERDVRHRVIDRPVRRQLALGILSTLVITVPLAISITGAELTRPVAQRDRTPAPVRTRSAVPARSDRPTDERLPLSLRRAIAHADHAVYLTEPTPLRPALR